MLFARSLFLMFSIKYPKTCVSMASVQYDITVTMPLTDMGTFGCITSVVAKLWR